MPPKQIVISGSLAYDRIMDFPGRFADHILPEKIHILSVVFMVDGLKEKFGGTAGNIAYSLALLGEKPLILATAGRDFDRYEARLNELGLPLNGILRIEEELTAGAYITTDQADNQITAFNPGAMNFVSGFRFEGIDPGNTLAIVSPSGLDDMLNYSRSFKKRGIPYIFDPGQSIPAQPPDRLAEMIDGAGMLICNDYELEMIMKATGRDQNQLLEMTPTLLTTLGEQGSRITTRDGEVRLSAVPPVQVCDPTGAGDAYRSGLLKGLAEGRPLEESARMGSTCAAYAVEQYGTQEHAFTQTEFWARYQAHFG
ncbi:MAG: carbohydrate kinase family protein [Proteobacteria bacterium]|nr:carbohydrate kinase family protein [Pseudomonadota bacterium]